VAKFIFKLLINVLTYDIQWNLGKSGKLLRFWIPYSQYALAFSKTNVTCTEQIIPTKKIWRWRNFNFCVRTGPILMHTVPSPLRMNMYTMFYFVSQCVLIACLVFLSSCKLMSNENNLRIGLSYYFFLFYLILRPPHLCTFYPTPIIEYSMQY
jgi:hypothetical protein